MVADDCSDVAVSVCKQFEFVIRSVNNVKTAREKTVNQSETNMGETTIY